MAEFCKLPKWDLYRTLAAAAFCDILSQGNVSDNYSKPAGSHFGGRGVREGAMAECWGFC